MIIKPWQSPNERTNSSNGRAGDFHPAAQIPAWVLWEFEKDAHTTNGLILVIVCDWMDTWRLLSWKHYVDLGQKCPKPLTKSRINVEAGSMRGII